jgi:hypothetical protein
MDFKARLKRITGKIDEKRGDRPVLVLMPGDDEEERKREFEKLYGEDFEIIRIIYIKRPSR